jgi:hypothetical protein
MLFLGMMLALFILKKGSHPILTDGQAEVQKASELPQLCSKSAFLIPGRKPMFFWNRV